MRKLACTLAVCIALLCGTTGCTGAAPSAPGAEAPARDIRIGVSLYDEYDAFISELMRWFVQYAGQAEREHNITITILQESADVNQVTQNEQVEGFIESGCDVICVNQVDRTDATVVIERAKAADIPVLFFNRELVAEDLQRWDRLYYVGAPAMQSGMIQGQIIVDAWAAGRAEIDRNDDEIIQYVMLEGEAGHQDAIVRTESSVNIIMASSVEMERIEGGIADWNRDKAETMMTRWLEQRPGEIEVVLCNNDEMALGAISALQKSGLAAGEWPLVAGIDGTPQGLAAVAQGEMLGTVYNDAAGQAEALLRLAQSLAQTGQPPADMPLDEGKYYRLDYRRVDESNVQEYLDMLEENQG